MTKLKSVTEIANSLENGPCKLTDSGLISYLNGTKRDLDCAIKNGNETKKHARFVEAAKLALRLRGIA